LSSVYFHFFRNPLDQPFLALRFSHGLVKRLVFLLAAGRLVKSLFSLFFPAFRRLPRVGQGRPFFLPAFRRDVVHRNESRSIGICGWKSTPIFHFFSSVANTFPKMLIKKDLGETQTLSFLSAPPFFSASSPPASPFFRANFGSIFFHPPREPLPAPRENHQPGV
jgi:hypothetical protein